MLGVVFTHQRCMPKCYAMISSSKGHYEGLGIDEIVGLYSWVWSSGILGINKAECILFASLGCFLKA